MEKDEIVAFWASVDRKGQNDCWFWTGRIGNTGYGKIKINGLIVGAHRVSWELHNGRIPDGLFVLHSCDNKACVNPAHLRVGTHDDNMRDCSERKRLPNARKTHCIRGHEFTEENTRWSQHQRCCRTCQREYHKAYHKKPRQINADGVCP